MLGSARQSSQWLKRHCSQDWRQIVPRGKLEGTLWLFLPLMAWFWAISPLPAMSLGGSAIARDVVDTMCVFLRIEKEDHV